MCDALRELFADELKERESAGLEKGIEQGIEKGEMAKLITLIMRKREKGQSALQIAEDLMEPVETVKGICDLIERNPGCDAMLAASEMVGK